MMMAVFNKCLTSINVGLLSHWKEEPFGLVQVVLERSQQPPQPAWGAIDVGGWSVQEELSVLVAPVPVIVNLTVICIWEKSRTV